MSTSAEKTSSPSRAAEDWPQTGLRFYPAMSLRDIEEAWQLVYASYQRAKLIDRNDEALHTVPEAIHPGTLVMIGRIDDLCVATMSAFLDGDRPLPLDRACPSAMARLRDEGRTLMEVGLFADRREKIVRSLSGLMEMMRFIFFYAYHRDRSDIVIGVNPTHEKFYRRCFGFEQFDAASTCPMVNDAPLVPLRLDINVRYRQVHDDQLPRGLAFFRAEPLQADAYDARYLLNHAEVQTSVIGRYLARADQ